MSKNKGVAVALAAAILASGGGLAGSVLTATPAHAAEQDPIFTIPRVPTQPVPYTGVVTPPSAPIALTAFSSPVSTVQGLATWKAPTGINGKILSYSVTIKETGKPNRVIMTPETHLVLTGLSENTSYVIEVRANIVSPSGRMATTPEATTTLRTTYFGNSVKVNAPLITIDNVTPESATVSLKASSGTVGRIDSYSLTVRRGTEVIQRASVRDAATTNGITRFPLTKLPSNTAYTVEVTANAVSFAGTARATSVPAITRFATPKLYASVSKPAVTLSDITPNGVSIAWQKPVTAGSFLSHYVVTVKERSTSAPTVNVQNLSSYFFNTRVAGLKPNTQYVVEVVAIARIEGTSTAVTATTTMEFTTRTAAPVR